MRSSPLYVVAALLVPFFLSACNDQPSGPDPEPVELLRLTSLTGGRGHSCGLTVEREVYCWGDGGSLTPAAVTSPPGAWFTALRAGGDHTCGLTADGQAYCWLVGNAPDAAAAVARPAGVAFVSLTSGGSQSCGLTATGEAYCWTVGAGGTSAAAAVPQPAGVTFTSLATGDAHACGLTAVGQAYCWGSNDRGQLGRGDGGLIPAEPSGPVLQPAGVTFASLTSGAEFTCGLTDAGLAYCWGNNQYGALGDGTTVRRSTPVVVVQPAGVSFTAMTAGAYHACGLTASGQAYCWGYNADGEVGDGTTNPRTVPTAVSHPAGVSLGEVAAGMWHTCARSSGGSSYCWGRNTEGQIGDGTTIPLRLSPTLVSGT